MIMMRTLARDITKYNQLEAGEDAQEETGWKLVSGPLIGYAAVDRLSGRHRAPGWEGLPVPRGSL
jgi:hypothetical protein